MKRIWQVLLIAFIAVNFYAFTASDLAGLWHYLKSLGPWGLLATADLLIALFIASVMVYRHARHQGVNPVPYMVLTLFTGSVGLLIYLARFWQTQSHTSANDELAQVQS